MEERLDRKDRHLLLACLAVTALSLAVGIPYFYRAFPEASIDFAITRDQARDQAESFLEARGLPIAEYHHSAAFQYDSQAKTFLERELGLEGATALIGRPVRLWRWSNRWTRELQKEELQVELTTTGGLVGFAHLIEEERPGARLAEAEARQLAEEFLVSLQRELGTLDFVESQTIQRPQRTDYSFTWKLAGFEVKDATYRFSVGIQGDQVGRYAESLKVPEAWQRDYQQLRSGNEATGLVATLLLILTWIGLLYCMVRSARRQEVRWKGAAIFGLIAFALTFLAQLNELPVSIHDAYQTTQTFGSFLTRALLMALLGGLGAGLFIAFIVAGAEPVYRRAYGHQLDLYRQFLPQGLRTKRFLLGSALGLALTAFFFAYQTLFYLTAERFGAWSPADIPYSEMVNTYFPWVTVLLIGFLPAVMEEFTSRAFSIPFLEGLLKSRWAAVVLSAFIWGFAHAGYPQQPFYIRGLEVGIGGLIIGAVMLRWGLLPALAWHYTVDALYTALILLRSSNPYFVLTAGLSAGILLVPLLIAALLYLRHRTFADPTPLLNRRETAPILPATPPAPAPALVAVPHSPLSARRWGGCAVVLGAGTLLFLVEAEEPLAFLDFAVDRQEAARLARVYLQAQGVEVDQYQQVVFERLQLDAESVKYLLEEEGLVGVDRLYRRDLQMVLWEGRFFKALQKEEYQVALRPDGALRSIQHQIAEEAPGADLSEDQARTLAEAQLRAYGLDPEALELKEASSEKLAARRDHRLVWEALPGDERNAGEARFRCEVKIAGDQPASLERYLKLPESWLRDRRESTTLRSVLQGALVLVIAAVALHLLWLVIRQIRKGLEWPPVLWAGGLGSALFLLGQLNALPTFYARYDTSLTPTVFTLTQGVVWVLGALFIGLLVVGALALAFTLYPHSLEYLRPSRWRGQFGTGVLLAGLAVVAGLEIDRLVVLVSARFAPHLLAPQFDLPPGLDSYLPWLEVLVGSLGQALLLPLGLGLAGYYAQGVLKKPHFAVLAVVALAALAAGVQAVDAGEFWLSLALISIRSAGWAALMALVLRDYLPAYILTGFLSSIIPAALSLLRQSAFFYQLNGALLLPIAALLVLGLWRSQRPRPSPDSGYGNH
ncbi:MAG: CPBP family intramembrane metalloprotease [Candidatus Latescibacteria bacterium]|nr:CPBP family intramembrane metalloprotease [Candidatus Latescibacterota bacterium]